MNWLTRLERPMKTLIVIAMTACAATPTQIDSTAGQASIECSEAATEYNRCIAIKPDQTPKPRSKGSFREGPSVFDSLDPVSGNRCEDLYRRFNQVCKQH